MQGLRSCSTAYSVEEGVWRWCRAVICLTEGDQIMSSDRMNSTADTTSRCPPSTRAQSTHSQKKQGGCPPMRPS